MNYDFVRHTLPANAKNKKKCGRARMGWKNVCKSSYLVSEENTMSQHQNETHKITLKYPKEWWKNTKTACAKRHINVIWCALLARNERRKEKGWRQKKGRNSVIIQNRHFGDKGKPQEDRKKVKWSIFENRLKNFPMEIAAWNRRFPVVKKITFKVIYGT